MLEVEVFLVVLYEFVSEWCLSHKFFCPTLSRLIFSGSDIFIYKPNASASLIFIRIDLSESISNTISVAV